MMDVKIVNLLRKRIGVDTRMSNLMKNLDRWIAEQEVPVVIALIVLILVSWGIYPLIAR